MPREVGAGHPHASGSQEKWQEYQEGRLQQEGRLKAEERAARLEKAAQRAMVRQYAQHSTRHSTRRGGPHRTYSLCWHCPMIYGMWL